MKFDVKKFWDDEAENHKEFAYMYKENKNARYPFYEVRLERLIELMSNLPKGRCLDAGCGMAKAMLPFLDNGWEANGVDSSAKMIDFAKENLIEKNYDPNIVSVGAVEDLSMFPDEHFDWIYIDAQHTYKACYEDMEAWLPKLRHGGLFSGDDYADILDTKYLKVSRNKKDMDNIALMKRLQNVVKADSAKILKHMDDKAKAEKSDRFSFDWGVICATQNFVE